MNYKINKLNEGTIIYRAAPFINVEKGNGKATSTNHNFAWYASSEAGAEPYVMIQPHLNNQTMSRIFKYEILKPLLLIDLSNAPTIQKLDRNMTYANLGNMSQSFITGNNGRVKRVSGENQLSRNKNTANRLRSFLLKHHPHISGWRHGKMERTRGGSQGEEILMFTPTKHVRAPAARGSAAPSPRRANSRRPLAPIPNPRPSPPQAGPSSSRQAGPSPRPSPVGSKGKKRQLFE